MGAGETTEERNGMKEGREEMRTAVQRSERISEAVSAGQEEKRRVDR